MSELEELYRITRERRFRCLEQACPLFDRCPNHFEYSLPINKDTWLVRNCPKVRETYQQSRKEGAP